MSDKKARYVGHPDGIDGLKVPLGNWKPGTTFEGEWRTVALPYGGELPSEIDGQPVPKTYVDSLLEQSDNWTTTAAKADEKKEA